MSPVKENLEQLLGLLPSRFRGRDLRRAVPRNRTLETQWGERSYPGAASAEDLRVKTLERQALVESCFAAALEVVGQMEADQAAALRSALSRAYPLARSLYQRLLLQALDQVLSLVILRAMPPPCTLGLCYSAFGDIAGIARDYASQFSSLLGGVVERLYLFACFHEGPALAAVPQQVEEVQVRLRAASTAEEVGFPGLKGPLMAALGDAVQHHMEVICTLDGDARLPLCQLLPLLAELFGQPAPDAVLGSRRVPGAIVSKPRLRHLTSVLNANRTEVLMGPVIARGLRDPQAILKVFPGARIATALRRLGFNGEGFERRDLQDGSVAVELQLLANLTADGRPPLIAEVPVAETYCYPSDPARMPILDGANLQGMFAAPLVPRRLARENPFVGQGADSLVLALPEDRVLKIPRRPFFPGTSSSVPESRTARDPHLFQAALALSETATLTYASWAQGRGFSLPEVVGDLLQCVAVAHCLPGGMRLSQWESSIALPLPSRLLLAACWRLDRFLLLRIGPILARIGMLPGTLIRALGVLLRGARWLVQVFDAVLRPVLRFAGRTLARVLRIAARARALVRRWMGRLLVWAEDHRSLLLEPLFWLDHLDQRRKWVHVTLQKAMRLYFEIKFVLEPLSVLLYPRIPLPALVQPKVRPALEVFLRLSPVMGFQVKALLDQVLALYHTLGEHGFLDGEISLANCGFEIHGKARLVLMDFGSTINANSTPRPTVSAWLTAVRRDFLRGEQVRTLRAFANGAPASEQAVEAFVEGAVGLFDAWQENYGISTYQREEKQWIAT